jgi:2-polyprenyl-3-methyl-5-hydroxy-6-metoxy-1,4-benzoquinol methylase
LAVFEHIRNPSYIIRETWRVLKPRGTAYHQIDFRDHIFQQSSLLFLLFPDKLFNFLFSHTGMWTNRIRYSEWRAIFIKNKFLITKEKIDTLPINSLKPHYVKKLGHLSQDDLLAAGGWFLLIK